MPIYGTNVIEAQLLKQRAALDQTPGIFVDFGIDVLDRDRCMCIYRSVGGWMDGWMDGAYL